MYIKKYILNEKIKAREIRLIDETGKQVGVVGLEQALAMGDEKELDVILISPEANPPVCKLVDFGHFRYEQQKKEKQAKKASKGHIIKELKLSPKISTHDYQVRIVSGKKFLEKGFKVKVSLMFKGREITHPELGREIMKRFVEDIKEFGSPDSPVVAAQRGMMILINPK